MTEMYKLFEVTVARIQRLSPSFTRITFTGPELKDFADNGYDQRIKLIVPGEPMRTYTARAVRRELSEVDLDMVLHGATGPASRFAESARPGDAAALIGPNAGYPGDHRGVEFRPHTTGPLLLAGDETAVPAVAGILERLPGDTTGEAYLEVPEDGDALAAATPPGLHVTWLPRNGSKHGQRLIEAVAKSTLDTTYAWLAGEAAAVRAMRRHLIRERGLDKAAVTFMGYWRQGKAESSE